MNKLPMNLWHSESCWRCDGFTPCDELPGLCDDCIAQDMHDSGIDEDLAEQDIQAAIYESGLS